MPTSQTIAIISAPEDAPFVARLATDLDASGYRVINVASERLHEDPCTEPGELRRRLEPAHAVLVALSPAAVRSEQVRCEIEFATLVRSPGQPQRLVSLLLAATEVPHSLKRHHTILFTAGPFEAAMERLKAHLTLADADDPFTGVPSTVAPTMPASAPTPALEPEAVPVAVPVPDISATATATAQREGSETGTKRARPFWRTWFSRR
ncbi:MAG: toll/interleukin-1 receptor domain-containing protein [Ktedonobacterales bacterium]|nr:toll/interleukin-1 receptor domain-containing protein [Ktedonobacterales bacterium]